MRFIFQKKKKRRLQLTRLTPMRRCMRVHEHLDMGNDEAFVSVRGPNTRIKIGKTLTCDEKYGRISRSLALSASVVRY